MTGAVGVEDVCLACHQPGLRLLARHLCKRCYDHHHKAGTLEEVAAPKRRAPLEVRRRSEEVTASWGSTPWWEMDDRHLRGFAMLLEDIGPEAVASLARQARRRRP